MPEEPDITEAESHAAVVEYVADYLDEHGPDGIEAMAFYAQRSTELECNFTARRDIDGQRNAVLGLLGCHIEHVAYALDEQPPAVAQEAYHIAAHERGPAIAEEVDADA